ncbi:unnamed protein product, partial [Symbiodinium sp. CCMP2456]
MLGGLYRWTIWVILLASSAEIFYHGDSTASTLQHACTVLESHHSKSVLPEQVRRRLTARTVKKDANFCPGCGQSWQKAANTAREPYTAAVVGPPWRDTWDNWDATQRSPRRKPSASPRRKGRGKGKDNGKTKGAGKQQTKTKEEQTWVAPTVDDLPAPPAPPTIAGPKRPSADAGAQPEKSQLDTLVRLLAGSSAALPEAAQQILAEVQQNSAQAATRGLHRAVADQAKARAALAKVQNSRASYLQAWSEYMSRLTGLVEKQVQEQGRIMEELDAAEIQWTGAERHATQQLAKLAATGEKEAEEEDNNSEEMVDSAIEQEAKLKAASSERQAATTKVLSVLTTLSQTAAEQAQEHAREGSRTPRRVPHFDLTKEELPDEAPQEDGVGNKPRGSFISRQVMCEPNSELCDGKHSIQSDWSYVGPYASQFLGMMDRLQVQMTDIGLPGHTVWDDPRIQGHAFPVSSAYDRAVQQVRADLRAEHPPLASVNEGFSRKRQVGFLGTLDVGSFRGYGPVGAIRWRNHLTRQLLAQVYLPVQATLHLLSSPCADGTCRSQASPQLPCTQAPTPGPLSSLATSEREVATQGVAPVLVPDIPPGLLGKLRPEGIALGRTAPPFRDAQVSHGSPPLPKVKGPQVKFASDMAKLQIPGVLNMTLPSRFVGAGPLSEWGPKLATRHAAGTMPSEISYMRATHVRVLPSDLDGPALYLPMARMVATLRPEVDDSGRGRYTVFEPGQRPRVRTCGDDWRLSDFAADAAGSSTQTVRTLQFVTNPIGGLPRPQVTLTPVSAPLQALAVPFDLRDLALNVVTAVITNQALMDDLPGLLAAGAPIPRLVTFPQGPPRAIRDSAGRRHAHFRVPLVDLEWAVVLFDEPDADPAVRPEQHFDALCALREDAPSLLGRARHLQPTFHPPAFECRPTYIFEDGCAIRDSLQFSLVRGNGPYGQQRFQYTLFAWHSRPKKLLADPEWTLTDLAVFAEASHDESLRVMHALQCPMPGIATPQLVATSLDVVDPWRIIPVDLRPIGGDIFCPPVGPDMPVDEVFARIRPFVTTNVAVQLRVEGQGTVYLQDQAGLVYDVLPDTLETIEWLAVRPFLRDDAATATTGTTATTTGVATSTTRVLLALVAGTQTLRTLPVEIDALDSTVALTRLISAVARSRALPNLGFVQQLAAYPAQGPDGVLSVPFVLASGRPGFVAIVIDITTQGQGLYSVEVPDSTWAEELLKPNQVARGLTYLVNGVPMQGLRRALRPGDYLQLVPNTCRGSLTISPATVWMRRIRQLRLWALPLAFPPLTHGHGGMAADLAEHAARAFLRYYKEVEAGRLLTFGTFGPGKVAIWVLCAWNPPLLFAVSCPVSPTLQESEPALRSSGAIAEGAILVAGERPISLVDSVVVQVDAADSYRTLLLPVPGDPEFFIPTAINPSVPIEPALHILPRLPYTAVYPPMEVKDGAVFRVRVPAGAVSDRAR